MSCPGNKGQVCVLTQVCVTQNPAWGQGDGLKNKERGAPVKQLSTASEPVHPRMPFPARSLLG